MYHELDDDPSSSGMQSAFTTNKFELFLAVLCEIPRSAVTGLHCSKTLHVQIGKKTNTEWKKWYCTWDYVLCIYIYTYKSLWTLLVVIDSTTSLTQKPSCILRKKQSNTRHMASRERHT